MTDTATLAIPNSHDWHHTLLARCAAHAMRAAAEAGMDISAFELQPAPHGHADAAKAVELVRYGKAGLLMKGSLHTDELMRETA